MSQVQTVKDANNIVDIIVERLELKAAGSSYKGLCPFHNEKTPSFFVSEDIQRFRCFGCGASGDVIEFLERYDGMTFLEALKQLADRAGIKLKEFKRSSNDEERERLLAILNLAKEYYHYILTKHQRGEKARAYLKERSITQDSIKLFQLGFALDSWDGLIKYLHHKKKFSLEEIFKTGLIIKTKTGRYYDRFRSRVVFPLKNHRGIVVGFSGRLLDKAAKEAKYINTPETLLYHKSQMLYGFSELFREIKKKQEVIVCEGEFDVISSVQAHVNHIVAIKGSALTKEQIKLFERVADKVLLCLDTDNAGIEASRRAIDLIKDSRLELRIIDLNDNSDNKKVSNRKKYKDVDELASVEASLWRKKAKQSISIYEFLLRVVLNKHDPQKPEGKRKIMDELAAVLFKIKHAVEQDYYLAKLAKALNVKQAVVMKDMTRISANLKIISKKQKKSVVSKIARRPSQKKAEGESESLLELERYLFFLLLRSDQSKVKDRACLLKDFELSLLGAQQIIKKIISFKTDFVLDKFAHTLAEDLKEKLFDFYLNPKYLDLLDQLKVDQEWNRVFNLLKKELIRRKINKINAQIEELDKKLKKTEEEETRLNDLLELIVKLQNQIKN